jgi:hypothetical protein
MLPDFLGTCGGERLRSLRNLDQFPLLRALQHTGTGTGNSLKQPAHITIKNRAPAQLHPATPFSVSAATVISDDLLALVGIAPRVLRAGFPR